MSEKKKDEVELKEAPESKDADWGEITVYKEPEQSREVIELKSIKTGKCLFKGGIIIAVQQPDRVVPYRHEFEFPDGWTREECFANFDDEAQKAATLWQKRQYDAAMAARKQVVSAGGRTPQLLGPSGKPAGSGRRRR